MPRTARFMLSLLHWCLWGLGGFGFGSSDGSPPPPRNASSACSSSISSRLLGFIRSISFTCSGVRSFRCRIRCTSFQLSSSCSSPSLYHASRHGLDGRRLVAGAESAAYDEEAAHHGDNRNDCNDQPDESANPHCPQSIVLDTTKPSTRWPRTLKEFNRRFIPREVCSWDGIAHPSEP